MPPPRWTVPAPEINERWFYVALAVAMIPWCLGMWWLLSR